MQNYFELFDLPLSYEVDLDVLASRYRQLQQSVHPDKFVTASEQSRRLSIQHAAHINDAYQALKDPLKRAQYILELHGIEENDSAMDSAFLMEQMALREELEGIVGSQDPQLALEAFLAKTDVLQKDILATLAGFFQDMSADKLSQASETVKKLQFIYKLREETISLEDEIY